MLQQLESNVSSHNHKLQCSIYTLESTQANEGPLLHPPSRAADKADHDYNGSCTIAMGLVLCGGHWQLELQWGWSSVEAIGS